MSIFVLVFRCIGATLHFIIIKQTNKKTHTQTHIYIQNDLQKDISQVDIASNSHPDKADNNMTARIKDDLRTANTAPSINDEKKKKRRRDPNKHYISGMFPSS